MSNNDTNMTAPPIEHADQYQGAAGSNLFSLGNLGASGFENNDTGLDAWNSLPSNPNDRKFAVPAPPGSISASSLPALNVGYDAPPSNPLVPEIAAILGDHSFAEYQKAMGGMSSATAGARNPRKRPASEPAFPPARGGARPSSASSVRAARRMRGSSVGGAGSPGASSVASSTVISEGGNYYHPDGTEMTPAEIAKREAKIRKNRESAQKFRDRQKNTIANLEQAKNELTAQTAALQKELEAVRAERDLLKVRADHADSINSQLLATHASGVAPTTLLEDSSLSEGQKGYLKDMLDQVHKDQDRPAKRTRTSLTTAAASGSESTNELLKAMICSLKDLKDGHSEIIAQLGKR